MTARRTGGAFLIALALHGVGAAIALHDSAQDGAHAGVGGLVVSLGPAGAAPGALSATPVSADAEMPTEMPQEETAVAETVVAEMPVPTRPTMPVPVSAVVVEQAELALPIAEEAQPVREPEPEIPIETAAPLEEPERMVAEPAPNVPKAPVKPTPPRKTETVMEKPRDPAPASAPDPAPDPAAKAAAAPRDTPAEPNQQTAAVPPGAGGKSGTEDGRQTGGGDSSPGGNVAGLEADYFTVLQAWLERHKEYPRRARRRRQEGTATLRFTVNRVGRVARFTIERSSGHRLLDREVLAMIERAQPLPQMPPEMTARQLEIVVPIAFYLR